MGTKDNPYFALIEAIDWSIDTCQIHEDTKIIAENALSGCMSISSIVIPEGVVSICNFAFSDLYMLNFVVIPSSVEYIGVEIFYFCFQLTEINFTGTEEQWLSILPDDNFGLDAEITVNYNYTL